MAYLTGFEYDLFISYAHVDNLTPSLEIKGWVAQFQQQLEILLWKRIGRVESVKIWWDPGLDGNQRFDVAIQQKIESSALFLALTSSGYLASEYCGKELRCFHRKALGDRYGLAVGDRLRIFNVLLNNLPYAKWPDEYDRTSGYVFHDAQRQDEFGEPIDPSDRRFHQALRTLVDSISRTFAAIQELSPKSSGTQASDSDFTIYVADTSDSLRPTRRRLINELRQESAIRVVANIPPPYEPDAHAARLKEELRNADLSVHLLDQFAGREVDGLGGTCYPQVQAELAIGAEKAPFMWVPQQLERELIEDQNYKQFLDELENGSPRKGNYDFVRGSSSSLTREILDKIQTLKTRTVQTDASPMAALLDTHFKDQIHAVELSKFLADKHVVPLINPEEDDPRRNLKFFEERLKRVSLLIVFFGSVAEEWVRARLAAAVQIAIAEGCPLKACGVYLAPPRKPATSLQLGPKWIPIELMDNTEGFKPESINRLLARVN